MKIYFFGLIRMTKPSAPSKDLEEAAAQKFKIGSKGKPRAHPKFNYKARVTRQNKLGSALEIPECDNG